MTEIQREIEKFSNEIGGVLGKMEANINISLEENERKCIDTAGDNSDRYVDCMNKTMKRIGKEQARFQHRSSFTLYKLRDCLTKQAAGAKDYEVCKSEGLKKISSYFEEMVRSIKN